jgi:hypothetical protein
MRNDNEKYDYNDGNYATVSNDELFDKQLRHADMEIIDRGIEYEDKKGENVVTYLKYLIKRKDENDGNWYTWVKIIKLCKVYNVPKELREKKALMVAQDELLSAIWKENINFITIYCNIPDGKDVKGFYYCYGIQVTEPIQKETSYYSRFNTADEKIVLTTKHLQEMADTQYGGLVRLLRGNFRQAQYLPLTMREAEVIRDQIESGKQLQVIRGIPKTHISAASGVTTALTGITTTPEGVEQNEEFIRAMLHDDYTNIIMATPISHQDLLQWSTNTANELSKYKSQYSGMISHNAGISVPMVFAGNLSATMGNTSGLTDTTGDTIGDTTGNSDNYAHNVGNNQGISHNLGFSDGQSVGAADSTSQANSDTASQGQSNSHSLTDSQGVSHTTSDGTTDGTTDTHSVGKSHTVGSSETDTKGESVSNSVSHSTGKSYTTGTTQGTTDGTTQGTTQGTSHTISNGTGTSHSISNGTGTSHSTTNGTGTSYSVGDSIGTSTSHNIGDTTGTSTGHSVANGTSSTTGTSQTITDGTSHSDSATDAYGENYGRAHTSGTSNTDTNGTSDTRTDGTSSAVTTTKGTTDTHTDGTNHSATDTYSESTAQNDSASKGESNNIGVSAGILGGGVGGNEGTSNGNAYSYSNGNTDTNGTSESDAHSTSESVGINKGESTSTAKGYNTSNASGTNEGDTYSAGNSHTFSAGTTDGTNHSVANGTSSTTGTSQTIGDTTGTSQGHSVANGTGTSQGHSISSGNNTNHSVSDGTSTNHSVSDGTSTNHSVSDGTSLSKSLSNSHALSNSVSNSQGTTEGVSVGKTVGQSISHSVGRSISDGITESQSQGISHAKSHSISNGLTNSQSVGNSVGSTTGTSQGRSSGLGKTANQGLSQSLSDAQGVSKGISSGDSRGQGVTTGKSHALSNAQGLSNARSNALGIGQGLNFSFGPTIGVSRSYQVFDEDKGNLIKLLEASNNRLNLAVRMGAFYVDSYVVSNSPAAKVGIALSAVSSWGGDTEMSTIQVVSPDNFTEAHLLRHASVFEPCTMSEKIPGIVEGYLWSTMMLTSELAAMTHLPRVETGGASTVATNIPPFSVFANKQGEIYFGKQINYEDGESNYDYNFSKKEFMHTLICGASGCGKTTSAVRIAKEVIEKYPDMKLFVLDWKNSWRVLKRFAPRGAADFEFYGLDPASIRPIAMNIYVPPKYIGVMAWLDRVNESLCLGYGFGTKMQSVLKSAAYFLFTIYGITKYNENDELIMSDDATVNKQIYNITLDKVYKVISALKNGKIPQNKEIYAKFIELPDDVRTKLEDKFAKSGMGMQDAFESILSKLEVFNSGELKALYCCTDPKKCVKIEDLIDGKRIVVLEGGDLDNNAKKFIIELISNGVFGYCKAKKNIERIVEKRFFILEEAHRIIENPRGANPSPLGVTEDIFQIVFNEGREFGIYAMPIVQAPSELPPAIVTNCSILIVHRLGNKEDIDLMTLDLCRNGRLDNRDVPIWLAKQPIGQAIVRINNTANHQDSEPTLIQVARCDTEAPRDEDLVNFLNIPIPPNMDKKFAESDYIDDVQLSKIIDNHLRHDDNNDWLNKSHDELEIDAHTIQ